MSFFVTVLRSPTYFNSSGSLYQQEWEDLTPSRRCAQREREKKLRRKFVVYLFTGMGCGSVVSSSLVDRLRDDPARPKTPPSLELLELWPLDAGWCSLAVEFFRWNIRRRFSHGLKRFRLLSKYNDDVTSRTKVNNNIKTIESDVIFFVSPIGDDDTNGTDTFRCLSGSCWPTTPLDVPNSLNAVIILKGKKERKFLGDLSQMAPEGRRVAHFDSFQGLTARVTLQSSQWKRKETHAA